jgi:hypothetical protein
MAPPAGSAGAASGGVSPSAPSCGNATTVRSCGRPCRRSTWRNFSPMACASSPGVAWQVMPTWKPAACSSFSPSMALRKFLNPRPASCTASSGWSMLTRNPTGCGASRSCASWWERRMKGAVPLVSTSTGLRLAACSRISRMPLRISGSPPVKAKRSTPRAAASSSSGASCASVGASMRVSPGLLPSWQKGQDRLQAVPVCTHSSRSRSSAIGAGAGKGAGAFTAADGSAMARASPAGKPRAPRADRPSAAPAGASTVQRRASACPAGSPAPRRSPVAAAGRSAGAAPRPRPPPSCPGCGPA